MQFRAGHHTSPPDSLPTSRHFLEILESAPHRHQKLARTCFRGPEPVAAGATSCTDQLQDRAIVWGAADHAVRFKHGMDINGQIQTAAF